MILFFELAKVVIFFVTTNAFALSCDASCSRQPIPTDKSREMGPHRLLPIERYVVSFLYILLRFNFRNR